MTATQGDLFDRPPTTTLQEPTWEPAYDGESYRPHLDRRRLSAQHQRVWGVMMDGQFRTLREIAELTGDPEASVSARLRDFRKPRFGAHGVARRRRGDGARGVYEYQLVIR